MTSKRQIRRLYDNDYTLSNTQRQELRHTHAGPEVTGPPSKKKKKKGCKKNKYNNHEVIMKKIHSWWIVLSCIHCQKHFSRYELKKNPYVVVADAKTRLALTDIDLYPETYEKYLF